MAAALPLRAALTRGALLTVANWPIVLIEFAAETLYKMAVGVPVIGGAVMVAVVLGADLGDLLSDGVRSTADVILGSLVGAPAALYAFVGAVGVVAAGGAILMFTIKAGTLALLADADRKAGEIQKYPNRGDVIRRGAAYSLASLLARTRHFARRALILTVGLSVVYGVIAIIYITTMTVGFGVAAEGIWAPIWPLLVIAGTITSVIAVAGVNLAFDLLRLVMITADCGVRAAVQRLRLFLIEDARHVIGIFAVVTAVQMLAATLALMLTAGLTTVAFLPLAGLIFLPLQLAAWLVRGLIFQALSLTALSAYQTQYRRFDEPAHDAAPYLVHQA
jgi:hypothetical protein